MSKPNLYYKKERVIVYVDGFNLYFGLKEAGFLSSKWLDIKRLCIDLLKPNQTLAEVKYFTSRVSNNPDKQKRQTTYLEALQTTDDSTGKKLSCIRTDTLISFFHNLHMSVAYKRYSYACPFRKRCSDA